MDDLRIQMADGVGLTEAEIVADLSQHPHYHAWNGTSLLSVLLIAGDKRLSDTTRDLALRQVCGFIDWRSGQTQDLLSRTSRNHADQLSELVMNPVTHELLRLLFD